MKIDQRPPQPQKCGTGDMIQPAGAPTPCNKLDGGRNSYCEEHSRDRPDRLNPGGKSGMTLDPSERSRRFHAARVPHLPTIPESTETRCADVQLRSVFAAESWEPPHRCFRSTVSA